MQIPRPGGPTGIKDDTGIFSLLPVPCGEGSSHSHMLLYHNVLALPETQIQWNQRLLSS